MNEHLNIEATRQLLNRALGQLEPATLAALRAAREQALARHAPDKTGPLWGAAPRRPMTTWLATALVAISLFGGIAYYWQQVSDSTDVDVAILTDDAPVDTYAN